jgi:hypothetical protein
VDRSCRSDLRVAMSLSLPKRSRAGGWPYRTAHRIELNEGFPQKLIIEFCLPSQFALVSRMKMPLRVPLLSFRVSSACGGVTSSPAVTGGSPPASPCSHGGQGTPSLFPVPAERGQGLPQSQPGKWLQTFRQSLRRDTSTGIGAGCESTSI